MTAPVHAARRLTILRSCALRLSLRPRAGALPTLSGSAAAGSARDPGERRDGRTRPRAACGGRPVTMILDAGFSPRSLSASRMGAAVLIALLAAPAAALGAAPGVPARAANAKSVSLRLTDVLHVLGGGIVAGNARFSKPSAMGACTSTPPATDYTANFSGPLRTKGILTVISDIYTYKQSGGPACNQKIEISQYKVLGSITGKITTVHGVGEQAFMLDATGPKSSTPPVYSLALKFIRGVYRAIIVVQSNQPIRTADMIRLGAIVDGRMQHTR